MSAALSPGRVLPGGYVLGARLGAGGYGAVFEGYDPGLDRAVAVKVLERPLDEQASQRFRDEGRLLARLQAPQIVQAYFIGALEDGRSFLVMERFGTGAVWSRWPLGACPPLDVALSVTRQLLQALAAAHAAGIIHRDVKEANLLYDDATGVAKLCDFGIARSHAPLAEQAPPTREGVVVGTDHYIAPERYEGVNDDPQSDLYAAGVVMFRLLVGRRPFERAPREPVTPHTVLLRAISERLTPDDLPGAPVGVARVCLGLLAPRRAERYPSATRALEALDDALRAPPTASAPVALPPAARARLSAALAPPPPPAPAPAPAPAPRWLWLAAGAALGAGLWWLSRAPAPRGVRPALTPLNAPAAPPSAAPAAPAAPPSPATPAAPPSFAAPAAPAAP
ncbi:MAG: serine/threonine protein kinase, partial [Deltaproteobacteria bacterium]|nr:serine/threonine protein kinase [Deltaproteobacteria bacterium]